jgi:hypothetical protein
MTLLRNQSGILHTGGGGERGGKEPCLGLKEADSLAVLFDGHAHLGEDGLALLPHRVGPPQLVLPALSEL